MLSRFHKHNMLIPFQEEEEEEGNFEILSAHVLYFRTSAVVPKAIDT